MKQIQNILIFGAGVAGQDVAREIKEDKKLNLTTIGFLDDNPDRINQLINGTKILGGRKDLIKISKKYKVDEVIIAIPSAEGESIAEVVNLCVQAKVKFKIVPRVKEIIEGKAKIATLRKVTVEDLLGRPVVKADVVGLTNFFKNKTVLITGSAGSIGSELARQITAYRPQKIIFIDWWENGMFELQSELTKLFPKSNLNFVIANIQDKRKISQIFEKFKPHYVFHAAAYKHVPLMEEHPDQAVQNNIFGTLNVAKNAIKAKAEKFVIISTDKAANPKNIMGATKLITEAIGKNLDGKTKFMAVRFGNVLDSYGSVVPIFRRQIQEGGPITITDPRMSRFFMTIPEAAQLILKAAAQGNGGELFVLDMGSPVKIVDLAEQMIRLSGLVPGKDIEIKFIGVRKGEKIHEKLFNSNESKQMIKTKDQKIFITQSLGLDLEKLPNLLKELQLTIGQKENQYVRQILKKYIKSLKYK